MQESGGIEKVALITPVKCEGLIESWLKSLEKEISRCILNYLLSHTLV